MLESIEIRKSLPSDLDAIEILYPKAFPDEDLLALVRTLLQEERDVLSLIATIGTSTVGHVAFTMGGIAETADKVALLGPLAVAPARQRQGIGSAIVRTGLQRLKSAGVTQVIVLGDPAYYGRFGFATETGVAPPYPLPAEWHEAWQSLTLRSGAPPIQGRLSLPPAWLQPSLWLP